MPSDFTATENRVLTTWAMLISGMVKDIRQASSDYGEVAGLLKSDSGKRKRFSTAVGNAEWWMDYEKHELVFIFQSLLRIGLAVPMAKIAMTRGLRGLLSSAFDGTLKEVEVDPKNPTKAVGAAYSSWCVMQAITCFGATMQQLVKSAETDDEAMLNAIRLDPTAINCTPCRRRLTRAVLEHDEDFLKDIAGAIARPKLIQSAQYPELEFCLYLMRRARVLPWFNEKRAWELFGVRLANLKLYSGDQRSLIRHIQRRKTPATRKLKTKSSPK